MADRVEYFTATIPANTAEGSDVTVPMVFNAGIVVEIDVRVPPGPSGLMGFHINAGGSQYVPRTLDSYVIADDDYMVWPIRNAINSGSWALTGYNTDVYDHLVYVTFQVNENGPPVGSQPGAIGSSALSIPASVL